MIICPKCGKENQDHYKFCLGCGNELPREGGPKGPMRPTPAAVNPGVRPGGPFPAPVAGPPTPGPYGSPSSPNVAPVAAHRHVKADALAFARIDQIERNTLARRSCCFNSAQRCSRVVFAPKRAECVVVKRLRASGEAVDASGGLLSKEMSVLGIGFQCDLAIGCQSKGAICRNDDLLYLGAAQQRRRPAA